MKLIVILAVLTAALSSELLEVKDFARTGYLIDRFNLEGSNLSLSLAARNETIKDDFYLSFDNAAQTATIQSALPVITKGGYSGKAAEFISRENVLTLSELPGRFFNEDLDTGNFSIEFSFMLYDTREKMILLRRHGPVMDRRTDRIVAHGIIFIIKDTRLSVKLDNFFHFRNAHLTVEMDKGAILKVKKWYHARLTYNAATGELKKYLNGKLEEKSFSTADRTGFSTVYYPSFLPDSRYPLVLGEGFTGRIDELKISMQERKKFTAKFESGTHRYVSQVLKSPAFSSLKQVILEEPESPSSMELRYRSSPAYFLPDDNVPVWTNIPIGKNLKLDFKPGNYFQYELILYNVSRDKNFILEKAGFDFTPDEVPVPPRIVSNKSGNGFVELYWEKSSEKDLAGWKIYYHKDDTPSVKTVLEFSLSEVQSVLGINMVPLTVFKRLEGLENGQLYHITITSYDEVGRNHESMPSRLVEVVPQLHKKIAQEY